ncbi:fatty acid desaturase family protein [Phytohabitans sp. LJ34]|uniref:fatty acid desaturase family protein n=1 Tax=Phytohabitans sp. LJ34 TaxID=3452217 RepID=UPI003F8A5631
MSTFESTVTLPRPRTRKRGSDYADLLSRVREAGLLDRRPGYYGAKIAATLGAMLAGWVAFALLADSWWQLLTAAFLAAVFAQTGFLAHDAGHRQIFRTRRANQLVGLVAGNLAIGLVFGWWVDKHHRHHAHPNQEGLDPDINGDNLAYTDGQVAARKTWFGRLVVRHQGWLFFPMLLLLAIDLRVTGLKALVRPGYRARVPEAVLFAVHVVGYLAALLLVLSPWQALAFFVVHQGLLGLYLGSVFAPNHKGMPILARDDDSDFLRRQVLTSRNVRGGRVLDFLLGGLNYQIEHHLFPHMPRPALKHAQPLVRAHCREYGLPYLETGLFDSYAQALGHLERVGRPAPEPVG